MKRRAAKLTAALLALGVIVTALACSTTEPSDQPGTRSGIAGRGPAGTTAPVQRSRSTGVG